VLKIFFRKVGIEALEKRKGLQKKCKSLRIISGY